MTESEAIAAIPAAANELAKKLGLEFNDWDCNSQLAGWQVNVYFDDNAELSIFGYDFALKVNGKYIKVKIPEGINFDYSGGIYLHAVSVIKLVTQYYNS